MRLLLAEDEHILSDALVTMLTHNNYSVDAVYDGQDALDYLRTGDYDGAILDIMMPKMDGVTVVKKIRAEGFTLPILLLTAKSQDEDIVEGLDAGADDYLTKPFKINVLLARIRSMTRRQPVLTNTVLSFGNLELNRSEYELQGPKGSLKLANKEFQMIEMLMEHPGQVIPTERFLEKIWGYDSDSEINVVWVYISTLRKKLSSVGTDVHIKAARGVGYSLEDKA